MIFILVCILASSLCCRGLAQIYSVSRVGNTELNQQKASDWQLLHSACKCCKNYLDTKSQANITHGVYLDKSLFPSFLLKYKEMTGSWKHLLAH